MNGASIRALAKATCATLAPFYKNGVFDHAGLIAELEVRAGGRKLGKRAKQLLAQLVAVYVQERTRGYN